MRYWAIAFFAFLALPALSQRSLLHEPFAVKYRFVDSIKHHFDWSGYANSLEQLGGVEKQVQKDGDEELLDELELLECEIRLHTVFEDAAIEARVENILASARAKKLQFVEADALQFLAGYEARLANRNSVALERYVEAYNIYSKYSDQDFPGKQSRLYCLAGSYFGYEDYERAEKYFKEALAVKRIKNDDLDLFNTIYNTLGLCYYKQLKYDTAEWYFRAIYDSATVRGDSAWKGIAAGNIGNIYTQQRKYDQAIPMLETDITNGLAKSQVKSAVGSMCTLAGIYYNRNEIDKAESILSQARNASQGHRGYWGDYGLQDRLFSLQAKVYAAKKEMALAYVYADSAMIAKDSSAAQKSTASYARSQEKIDYMRNQLETEKLGAEKKMQEFIRNSLIASIFLICVIGILFINRQRLKQKKLEAEKKNAESDLDIAALQLDNIRQSVQEKNKLIEHFTAELERVKAGEEQQVDNDLLFQLESATILTDEQWENFRLLFEKVHKGFFANLKKKMPDLTPAEIRFLALAKLKLSSKEMASMLGISTNAIRIYRHRLRRKLELDKEDMIEELVANI